MNGERIMNKRQANTIALEGVELCDGWKQVRDTFGYNTQKQIAGAAYGVTGAVVKQKRMVFKQDILKVLKLLLIGICFIAVCVIMLVYIADHYHDVGVPTTKLLKYKEFAIPVLVAAIVLFSAVTICYAIRLTKNTPVLTIGRDGIVEHSTIVSVGLIPWSEIKSISVLRVGIQTFIMVDAKNFKKLISKLPKYKQIFIKTTMKLGFPPIAINMNSVREKPGEVLAIMTAYWEAWKKSDGNQVQ